MAAIPIQTHSGVLLLGHMGIIEGGPLSGPSLSAKVLSHKQAMASLRWIYELHSCDCRKKAWLAATSAGKISFLLGKGGFLPKPYESDFHMKGIVYDEKTPLIT